MSETPELIVPPLSAGNGPEKDREFSPLADKDKAFVGQNVPERYQAAADSQGKLLDKEVPLPVSSEIQPAAEDPAVLQRRKTILNRLVSGKDLYDSTEDTDVSDLVGLVGKDNEPRPR